MWYVYFLRLNNGDVYVGPTDDLKRRFASHVRGTVISTRENRPLTLGAYVAVGEETLARRLERYFK
jgi:putative endonuclease